MCISVMNKISKKLGQNLKRIREEKSMTQGDVCRATGFDRGYISRVENGEKNPTLLNLGKIAGALGISVGELLK